MKGQYIKRIRIITILKLASNGNKIYNFEIDLNRDISDIKHFFFENSFIGFAVEKSYFEKDKYDKDKFSNDEFETIKEYYIGEKTEDSFIIGGKEIYKKDNIEIVDNFIELQKKLVSIVSDIKDHDILTAISNLYDMECEIKAHKR